MPDRPVNLPPTRPYAQARVALLRSELSPSVKLVAIAIERLDRLGADITTRRLMFETGLPLRTIQAARAFLGRAAAPHRPRKGAAIAPFAPRKGAEKGAEKGATIAPSDKDVFVVNNTESIESKGEQQPAPPPLCAEGLKTTATENSNNGGNRESGIGSRGTSGDHCRDSESRIPIPGSRLSVLARAAQLFADPAIAAEVPGHVAGDIAAGLYRLEDLDAWLTAPGAAVAYPSHLRRLVPAFVARRSREAFAKRLRQIRDLGLIRALHRTASPARSGRVRLVDDGDGLLVLDEFSGGAPGLSAADLRMKIAAMKWPAGSASGRALAARLAAVEAGRPDPAARKPDVRPLHIRTPEQLAEWRFEAAQPCLFPIEPEGP